MTMTRKEFLLGATGLTLGLAAAACGGDGAAAGSDLATGASDAGATSCASPSVTIGANHGHALVLTQAEVDAGEASTTPTTFDIQGTSGHDHTVTLAQSDFTALKAGQSVTKTSTVSAGHTHSISIRC